MAHIVEISLIDRTRYSFEEGKGPSVDDVMRAVMGRVAYVEVQGVGEVHLIPRVAISRVVIKE